MKTKENGPGAPPVGAWTALAEQIGGPLPTKHRGIAMTFRLTTEKPDTDGAHLMNWQYAGEENGESVFRGVRDCAGQTRRVRAAGGAR